MFHPQVDSVPVFLFNTRPNLRGQIAQLVEQRIENPRVGGSIPSLATILRRFIFPVSLLSHTRNLEWQLSEKKQFWQAQVRSRKHGSISKSFHLKSDAQAWAREQEALKHIKNRHIVYPRAAGAFSPAEITDTTYFLYEIQKLKSPNIVGRPLINTHTDHPAVLTFGNQAQLSQFPSDAGPLSNQKRELLRRKCKQNES